MECPRCGSIMEGGICNNCGFPVTISIHSEFGTRSLCSNLFLKSNAVREVIKNLNKYK